MKEPTAIGRAAIRLEGRAKVTGEAKYSADINLPGMLWGKCLRSPYPHARIISVDTTAARVLPGVHSVITGRDIPDILIGKNVRDLPILARDRVRFVGEKVAAVAADNLGIAEEALALIDVEYEELERVTDAIEAMRPGAPILHESASSYDHRPIPASFHGENFMFPPIPNVVSRVVERHGDLTAGFAAADRIFEHSFQIPPVHHGYIEPHACLVHIPEADAIEVWLSNKAPFTAREQLAQAIGVTPTGVRINPTYIGGDFGGKGDLGDSLVCYYLAKETRRPVKMVMTYSEELSAGNPRHSGLITIRTGVKSDGRITARQARIVFDNGAYAAFRPLHTLHGSIHAGGPYRVPSVEIECLVVYTNTVPRGHMRAPGAPQVVFALESHMDIVAHELGLDPLEFRLKNALDQKDTEAPLGEHYRRMRSRETLEAAGRAAGWGSDKPPLRGRGVAMYDRPAGGGQSNATISLDSDGLVTLLTGVPDTGTGALTVLQQIVAEEIQLPLESVRVERADTDSIDVDSGAGASRVTHAAGQAAADAARGLRIALVEAAAAILGISIDQIEMRDGLIVSTTGQTLAMNELVKECVVRNRLPLPFRGTYASSGEAEVTSFAAQVAEVEVDPETGQVRLRKIVTAHDVGTVINPLSHQGQIEGGAIQGLGQAVMEDLMIEDGQVGTVHLGDYKIPTIGDIPELITVLLEEDKTGPAPYGGKAIGEHSNVALAAAIANAVYDATGVRVMQLPISPETVYNAIHEKRQADG